MRVMVTRHQNFGGGDWVDDYLHLKRHGASGAELEDFEVMTHPVFGGDGNLVEGLAPDLFLPDLVSSQRYP